jgi:hypothetical protein
VQPGIWIDSAGPFCWRYAHAARINESPLMTTRFHSKEMVT